MRGPCYFSECSSIADILKNFIWKGMSMKQEARIEIRTEVSRKRWTAPEVTRLDFPKTAANRHNRGEEFGAAYFVTS